MTMENHHFQWVNPLQMAMFNSFLLVYRRVNAKQDPKKREIRILADHGIIGRNRWILFRFYSKKVEYVSYLCLGTPNGLGACCLTPWEPVEWIPSGNQTWLAGKSAFWMEVFFLEHHHFLQSIFQQTMFDYRRVTNLHFFQKLPEKPLNFLR